MRIITSPYSPPKLSYLAVAKVREKREWKEEREENDKEGEGDRGKRVDKKVVVRKAQKLFGLPVQKSQSQTPHRHRQNVHTILQYLHQSSWESQHLNVKNDLLPQLVQNIANIRTAYSDYATTWYSDRSFEHIYLCFC